MKYLLDTNICIYFMRESVPAVAARMDACEPWEIGISSITLAELEYGVVRVTPEQQLPRRLLLNMLQERVTVAPFDAAAARAYAEIRCADPQRGRNALDKLIAAHAVSLDAVLVTNNEADFRRFPGLVVQNWAA